MQTVEDIWNEADLAGRRLAGLALNPAAPEDVLLRLLADAPPAARMLLCRDRDLPEAVVDAVLAHPDARTRSFLARNPQVAAEQRAKLVDDPDWRVRAHLADGPRHPAPPLAHETVVRMISTYGNEELGGSVYLQFSNELHQAMPTHPDPKVRAWGVGMWTGLSEETRAALLADPDDEVRRRAERHRRHQDPAWVESNLPEHPCHGRTDALVNLPLTRAAVDSVLRAPAGPQERSMIARNASLPYDVVVLPASDPDPEARKEITRRADLGPDRMRALAVDPDPEVRLAVSVHPAGQVTSSRA
ncbi:hypothetical protein U5640_02350 [Streptomyces sp. SS7]|uniref:hypothetical protein n=1 Tax=Streptomyces sp. SS7 TaxID=3108485 RepID=UPI0030EB3A7F